MTVILDFGLVSNVLIPESEHIFFTILVKYMYEVNCIIVVVLCF
jgi:hypothetical protein